ncbi:MAG TPA: tRNA (adenosine(37)-N6)-threonylcarbamoyltransferase complex dimerization subunit type 1 TsaB [Thermoanaerobaculia bacterium]|nr:tRNA (adenosine(37)-N6)-threonylcarbamoyltransferase complex dimerization subunit type 1 TsaB [Thermoanaerobaculia bacterium]
MSDPLILSVDASMPVLSIALLRGDALIGAIALEGKQSRNEKLLPSIDWLLAEAGVALSSVDLLVATRGPGSFTGVRVAMATMQGLAFAIEKPLCTLSTHEAVALGTPARESALVFGDAGRGDVYASLFRDREEVLPPTLLRRDKLDDLSGGTEMIDLDLLVASQNIALLAARRARQIREMDMLHDRAESAPIYVRLAEAEVKLRLKLDG